MKALILFMMSLKVFAGSVEIITASELKNDFSKYVVIDARESGFETSHIPGSFSMQWKDFAKVKPSVLKMLVQSSAEWGLVTEDVKLIESTLQSFGISNDSYVVVVGEPKLWGTEGRIAWNLLYWGLQKVRLLDGGYAAWEKEKYATESGEKENSAVKPGSFKVSLQTARRAEKAEVLSLIKSKNASGLFDIRTDEEYKGLKKMFGQSKAGHIPTAKLIPVASLYSDDGTFIGKAKLADMMGSFNSTPISYCLGGIRSALFAVLYEAYFDKIPKNYDGSVWNWETDQELVK